MLYYISCMNKQETGLSRQTRGFQFVKRSESPDISIRRVGVNAGKIDKNYGDKNEETHYFIHR